MSGNKLFWKTGKPFFSKNGSQRGNIKLVERDKLLQDHSEVPEGLNNFFIEAVSSLDVNEKSYKTASIYISDPIEKLQISINVIQVLYSLMISSK